MESDGGIRGDGLPEQSSLVKRFKKGSEYRPLSHSPEKKFLLSVTLFGVLLSDPKKKKFHHERYGQNGK